MQWLKSFYSLKMQRHYSFEPTLGYGAAEFLFPDDDKLTGNVFAGPGGF